MRSASKASAVSILFIVASGLLAQAPEAALVSVKASSPAAATIEAQSSGKSPAPDAIAALHAGFAHPPDDCRIMMRWWWFGPSATKPELQRELEQMKAAGIGGVEIATLYPLALDDAATGFHNYSFLSDEHIENLRFAAGEARRLGLRVDMTLGSGWPFGGPHISATQAAGELRVETVPASAGTSSIAVPPLEAGEQIIAAFVVAGSAAGLQLRNTERVPTPSGPRLSLPASTGVDRTVLFFISSRTGMMVKRAAQGGAGFVLDHYNKAAIEKHLLTVGDRLLSAFGDHPPYAVFSDSLEDYGSDWTSDLPAEFQRRRGYDLVPHLPALIGDIGPETASIRHDWGQTLTELANARFLKPMQDWARAHHTLLRSQTYGFPPVTLSSNHLEDLPEGEGKASINMWREFSDTRWAASAGHLFNRRVISSETWTWLHSPAFRATPLDMKAEADLHFLQGINQLVGHGWPYSPESAGEPGWSMYAAGALNAHNPWFLVMPDLTAYLQRVSYALRLGEPANDIAVLLPNDDVWASFKGRIQQNQPPTSLGGFNETGSNVTVDESMPAFIGSELIPQILDAGFNFDFIDADAIDRAGIPYKILFLPGVDRIPQQSYEKILDFARRGGIVVATRRLPTTSPGYRDAAAGSSQVQAISETLFHGHIDTAHFVLDEHMLGDSLASWLRPDFVTSPRAPQIGFIHRHLESGDLYFLANTSNQPHSFDAIFRSGATKAEIWDPFTGQVTGIADPSRVRLDLLPYESRILFFSNSALSPVIERSSTSTKRTDISHNWLVTFGSDDSAVEMPELSSWTETVEFHNYSGIATYRRSIEVSDADVHPGRSVLLDFGDGTPVEMPEPLPRFNMRAYFESPVREAAQVYVNDQFAGYIWHPPFRLEIAHFLKSGKSELRIVVGNTAINQLAGTSLPTYRLLYDRYGVEFIPQGMQDLKALPSGLLGAVTLISEGP
jgi:alpha-L-rhamnosidase